MKHLMHETNTCEEILAHVCLDNDDGLGSFDCYCPGPGTCATSAFGPRRAKSRNLSRVLRPGIAMRSYLSGVRSYSPKSEVQSG